MTQPGRLLSPRHPATPPSHHPSPITHHPSPSVTVELFGVPRLIAGARSVAAAGRTMADLAADLVRRNPALAGRVLDVRRAAPPLTTSPSG